MLLFRFSHIQLHDLFKLQFFHIQNIERYILYTLIYRFKVAYYQKI